MLAEAVRNTAQPKLPTKAKGAHPKKGSLANNPSARTSTGPACAPLPIPGRSSDTSGLGMSPLPGPFHAHPFDRCRLYQLTQINADAAEMVQSLSCPLIRHGRRASSKDP
jgi:hypothetical protein